MDSAVRDESPGIDEQEISDDAPRKVVGYGRDRVFEQPVRDAAIEAIARYWPEHQETLPFLRRRELEDPTPWLREKAKSLADELEARLKTK